MSYETASNISDVANWALVISLVVGVAATFAIWYTGHIKEPANKSLIQPIKGDLEAVALAKSIDTVLRSARWTSELIDEEQSPLLPEPSIPDGITVLGATKPEPAWSAAMDKWFAHNGIASRLQDALAKSGLGDVAFTSTTFRGSPLFPSFSQWKAFLCSWGQNLS
jgi:hypothetical protein